MIDSATFSNPPQHHHIIVRPSIREQTRNSGCLMETSDPNKITQTRALTNCCSGGKHPPYSRRSESVAIAPRPAPNESCSCRQTKRNRVPQAKQLERLRVLDNDIPARYSWDTSRRTRDTSSNGCDAQCHLPRTQANANSNAVLRDQRSMIDFHRRTTRAMNIHYPGGAMLELFRLTHSSRYSLKPS